MAQAGLRKGEQPVHPLPSFETRAALMLDAGREAVKRSGGTPHLAQFGASQGSESPLTFESCWKVCVGWVGGRARQAADKP